MPGRCLLHPGGGNMELTNITVGIVLFFLWTMAAIGLGRKFISAIRLSLTNFGEELVLSHALGLSIIILSIFFIGWAGLIYKSFFLLFLSCILVFARNEIIKTIRKIISSRIRLWQVYLEHKIVGTLFGVLVLLTLLSCLSPPREGDSLLYHLYLPSLYVRLHQIVSLPGLESCSSFPQNIEILWMLGLIFNSDIFSQLMHFSFGLMIALSIYTFLRCKKYDSGTGVLGAIIFYTIPTVLVISPTPMIDLAIAYFTFVGFICFLKWAEFRNIKLLIISAILTGVAVGSKYTALVIPAIVFCLVFLAKGRWNEKLKSGFLYLSLSLLIASPWYIKNLIIHRNPFFPFFLNIFGLSSFTHQTIKNIISPRNLTVFGLKHLITMPWEITFTLPRIRTLWNPIFSPIFLSLLPIILIKGKRIWQEYRLPIIFLLLFVPAWFYFFPAYRYGLIIFIIASIILAAAINIVSKEDRLLKSISISAIYVWLFVSLGVNIYYNLIPLRAMVKWENKETFLSQHFNKRYPFWDYLNKNVSPNKKFLFVSNERPEFYYVRPILVGLAEYENLMIEQGHTDSRMALQTLKKLNVSHILQWGISESVVVKWLDDWLDKGNIKIVFKDTGGLIYALK